MRFLFTNKYYSVFDVFIMSLVASFLDNRMFFEGLSVFMFGALISIVIEAKSGSK